MRYPQEIFGGFTAILFQKLCDVFSVLRCFACIKKITDVIIANGSERSIPFNFLASRKAELVFIAVE